MRFFTSLRLRLAREIHPNHAGDLLLEAGLLGLGIAILEGFGRAFPDESGDVVGVLLLLLTVGALANGARSGRAPLSRRFAHAVRRAVEAVARRTEPAAALAFRLPEAPTPCAWAPRRTTLLVLSGLVVVALLLGPQIPDALLFTRWHLAYTPYVLLLTLLWLLFGLVSTLGLVPGRADRAPPATRARRLVLRVAAFVGLFLAFAALPGWVPLALFGPFAVVAGRGLVHWPWGRFWLWRRDEEGRVAATRIDAWLRATWLAALLALLFVVALAQTGRLLAPTGPSGRFGITTGMGLAATAAAFLLAVRAARLLGRLLGPARQDPARPLVRTLWWPGRTGPEPAWLAAARAAGWRVTTSRRAPRGGFDLVVGIPDHGQRFVSPPDDLPLPEATFRLARRFEVVYRRAFFRRLQRLDRMTRHRVRSRGGGYLFCPHAWPVPSLIRDPPHGEDGSAGGKAAHVGPPFRVVFPLRVRRYLAEVFRRLDVDLVYWDDTVAWAPLRAALGVMLEAYDQGFSPLQDRHFVGLPRVRVTVQEAEDVDRASPDAPGPDRGPPPVRARILLIRRDAGGEGAEAPDEAPSSRRPVPVPV